MSTTLLPTGVVKWPTDDTPTGDVSGNLDGSSRNALNAWLNGRYGKGMPYKTLGDFVRQHLRAQTFGEFRQWVEKGLGYTKASSGSEPSCACDMSMGRWGYHDQTCAWRKWKEKA